MARRLAICRKRSPLVFCAISGVRKVLSPLDGKFGDNVNTHDIKILSQKNVIGAFCIPCYFIPCYLMCTK